MKRHFRELSSVRAAAIAGLLAAMLLALGVGVWQAVREIADLGDRRDQALESDWDLASVTGATADAFRRLRPTLGAGDRFALVFAPEVDRDQRGLYRLVSLSYLYPAVATSDPDDADAVMVFGAPSLGVRREFDEIGVVAGVWLGRRS